MKPKETLKQSLWKRVYVSTCRAHTVKPHVQVETTADGTLNAKTKCLCHGTQHVFFAIFDHPKKRGQRRI